MNDLKDYREKELKNYVIGNVLLMLYFTGKIQEMILWDSSQIIKEYRKAVENKNFNSLTEVMTTLIKSGKCIIEVMKTVYSYAELFAA